MKPLGQKAYGHVAHLPGSRMGPGDHHCHEGQARIACEKARDRHDRISVTEKCDGSCVSAAKVNGTVLALNRSGYLAQSSPYEQHQWWAYWVRLNYERFDAVLEEGERLVGEWLAQAHGTRYDLPHEPFAAFDLMLGDRRLTRDVFLAKTAVGGFVTPRLLHEGGPICVEEVLRLLEPSGHGALDPVEGAVWRVERADPRKGLYVDFLAKYVRPDKVDGSYLPELTGGDPVWNWKPAGSAANEG